jgi:hypothetical protein
MLLRVNRGKELKRMTGLKHDLLTNASSAVREHAAEWVLDRLKAVGTAVSATGTTVVPAADISK